MKSFLLSLAAFFLTAFIANAQTISGKVTDIDGKPIAKATVSLLRAKDSSILKLYPTDKDGSYKFEEFPAGMYIISATSIGYAKVYTKPFEYTGGSLEISVIQMDGRSTQMAGVTVTARKPLVEVKADKMVVNVEGTINATGNDALELLRKSPGVLIDKDDNISMAGKNGVQIYIDGKPSPLSGSDLASYLRSLQSANIEAIELITNPSAKYEASGNAGIINIRLKKNKSFGTNGSVNAGYNIGVFGKYNGGINFNHRNKRVNIFGNYNYYNGLQYNTQSIYREQADSIFDQTGKMKNSRENHNFKAGVDYFLNSKNTLGVMVNGNISQNEMTSDGPMSIAYKPTGIVNRILRANTNMDNDRNNLNFNANYRFADTSGRELNVDADYGLYNLHNNQYLPNIYYEPDGTTELYRNVYRTNAPTNIDIYALKADYEQKLGKAKIGFGGKIGFVETKNDFNRYTVINNTDVYDRDRSNTFDYKENINALYVNYNRPFKGFAIQLGLRAENTNSDGKSKGEKYNEPTDSYIPYDSTVTRHYTDLFPSAAITFNKNPMSQLSISYSRRIDRPRYERLNPFEFKLNDYTYSKGNTQLKPQYTNSFSITHTYKYKLTTTLNYSHVKDMFVQTFDTLERSKMYQTTKNLATQDVASLNITYPFMYKKFTMFNNLTANYTYYNADFGVGKVIDESTFNVQYYVQNTLKFAKDWTAELSGLYLSPFIWEGIFKGKSMGFIDVGLQKNIMKGKGTVKASVSDIFKTMRFKGESDFSGAYTRVNANWESRQFKINFTYRFGSAQVKGARQRKTALDEESSRASGNGNTTPGQ